MPKTFFENHKKPCLIAGGMLGAILLIIYLFALFQPGYWYDGAFLSKQADGSFAGANSYASYQMYLTSDVNCTSIAFSVNDLTKEYQITGTDTGSDISIYENDSLMFHGQTLSYTDGAYVLIDDSGNPDIQIGVLVGSSSNVETSPTPEELFPSATWLYNRAVSNSTDRRGEPAMLVFILIAVSVLILDIKYPDLFFTLRYRHYVDGGEPSGWYRDSQKLGRVLLVIVIIFCMGKSLYPF